MTTLKVKHLTTLLRSFEEYKSCIPLLYLLAKLHDLSPYDVEQRFADTQHYWRCVLDNQTVKGTEAQVKKWLRFTDTFLLVLCSGGDWENDCLSASKRRGSILFKTELSPQEYFNQLKAIQLYIVYQTGAFNAPSVAMEGNTIHITTTIPAISRPDNKP